jgi:hypothetical protein
MLWSLMLDCELLPEFDMLPFEFEFDPRLVFPRFEFAELELPRFELFEFELPRFELFELVLVFVFCAIPIPASPKSRAVAVATVNFDRVIFTFPPEVSLIGGPWKYGVRPYSST